MSSSLDQMTTMLTTELDTNVTLPFANEQDTAEVGLELFLILITPFSYSLD